MALKIIKNNQDLPLTRDFGEYNITILEFMNKLYTRSMELYERKYQGNNRTNTRELDIQKIKESIKYVIDYLHYYYKFYQNNFLDICMCIFENLKFVTVLAPKERGIYGKYESNQKCIYINPKMNGNINLNGSERIRLYINHELGHIINHEWMLTVIQYLNTVTINKNKELIYDGFSLLDEAITQNLAEDIAYYYSRKSRPNKRLHQSTLFNRQPYQTNYDYYGELQTPTINFARTLRGIGNIVDDNDALKELCVRALKYDFVENIINEYYENNQIHNLHILLLYLGIIKNASYAAFGMADKKYLNNSAKALEEATKLSMELRNSNTLLTK